MTVQQLMLELQGLDPFAVIMIPDKKDAGTSPEAEKELSFVTLLGKTVRLE